MRTFFLALLGALMLFASPAYVPNAHADFGDYEYQTDYGYYDDWDRYGYHTNDGWNWGDDDWFDNDYVYDYNYDYDPYDYGYNDDYNYEYDYDWWDGYEWELEEDDDWFDFNTY